MTEFLDTLSQMMSTAQEGDEEQRVKSQAQEEAAALGPEEKRERGEQVRREIQECLQKLAQVQESLQALPPRQLFGPEGDALKDQADEWVRKLSILKIRQSVFPPQA
ncbi:MAG: hypothetical protein ACI4SG_08810 [Oligosphaeraceae bacterium]